MAAAVDESRARLKELIAESATSATENEATTRLRTINVLLEGCLGWSRAETVAEERIDGKYLDYTLQSPDRIAVLEAKRAGLHFELPAGFLAGRLSVKSFMEQGSNNRDATRQVAEYCQKSGTAVAMLCNGPELFAFLGSRADGRSPLDGDGFAYPSLESMLADFDHAWNLLSRDGLIRGDLLRELGPGTTHVPAPAPLSGSLTGYPGYRQGTAMETDLDILGDLFFQDLPQEETVSSEFLRECYCPSGALSQYSHVSKEILRSRYASLAGVVDAKPATTKRGTSRQLTESVVSSALTKRPVVLLGNVGVGKTMFLKHLFRVDAADLADALEVIYVDFLEHPGHEPDLEGYVAAQIEKHLLLSLKVDPGADKFVRRVYKRELERFSAGVAGGLRESDPTEFKRREIDHLTALVERSDAHIQRVLTFLQGERRVSFVLVLDNVDQHPLEFQEQIFVAGQAFAKIWPCAVFLSLRPDTYHRSATAGALQAYQPRVFSVEPPRVDEVVLKRLRFAQRQLAETGRLDYFPKGLTIDSENLRIYMATLVEAFERNRQLNEFIDNVSAGNTRAALGYISSFIGTGYVQTTRILDAYDRGDLYTIPMHEFQRAVLFGEHEYYDPSKSPIPNLFHVESADRREHFLLGILLSLVEAMAETNESGFAPMPRLYARLQELGYARELIEVHLKRAVSTRLVEHPLEGKYRDYLRITSKGAYLWKVLGVEFAYVDAIIVDTPILIPEVRSHIRDAQTIEERLERGRVFVNYLSACWDFTNAVAPFNWPDRASAALADIERALSGARRAKQRRRGSAA